MIKNLYNKFVKSENIKPMVTLVIGSIIAQLLTLLAMPLQTRLYTAEMIGVFTFVLSVVNIFVPVINLRYDVSVVNEDDDSKTFAIMKLSFIIGFVISCVVSTGYLIYIKFIKIEYQSYGFTTIFVFLLLIIATFQNVLISYNNRYKRYKLMSSTYLVRNTFQSGSMIGVGYVYPTSYGLLFSQTLGQFFSLFTHTKYFRKELEGFKEITKKDMMIVAEKHRKQALFSTPAALANSMSYSSVNLAIASLFGLGILGYYSISYRVLGLPLVLISGNVSKVYFQSASRSKENTGSFFGVTKRTFYFLLVLAVFMVLGMIYVVPPLFSIIFGEEWVVAGDYVKILAPMFGIRFITSSLAMGLIVAGKQKVDLLLQSLFVCSSLVAFVLSQVYEFYIKQYLTIIMILFSVVYIVYLIFVFYYSKENDTEKNEVSK